MITFLASLSPVEWLSIAAASWLILSAVVAVPIGRAMRRAGCGDAVPAPYPPPVPDPRHVPFVDDEGTRWLPFLPPVPPSRHATDDWMALVPVECLSDDEIGLRCADIEAREGWWAA